MDDFGSQVLEAFLLCDEWCLPSAVLVSAVVFCLVYFDNKLLEAIILGHKGNNRAKHPKCLYCTDDILEKYLGFYSYNCQFLSPSSAKKYFGIKIFSD